MRREEQSRSTIVEHKTAPMSVNAGHLDAADPRSEADSRTGCESTRCRTQRTDQTGCKIAVPLESEVLCSAFGVSDVEIATRLLSQLVSVLQPDPTKPVGPAVINQALAMIENIRPTDGLEAMTATMLVAAQHAALESMRRGMHPDQTPAGRAMYVALGLKAMRTYSQLLEALNHGRGKGVEQRIIVERVTVAPGAQAVVGAVDLSRGGGNAK